MYFLRLFITLLGRKMDDRVIISNKTYRENSSGCSALIRRSKFGFEGPHRVSTVTLIVQVSRRGQRDFNPCSIFSGLKECKSEVYQVHSHAIIRESGHRRQVTII